MWLSMWQSHIAVTLSEALAAGDKGGEPGIVFKFVEESTANVLKALCKRRKGTDRLIYRVQAI